MTIITETTVPVGPVSLLGVDGSPIKLLTFDAKGVKTATVAPAQLAAEFKARPNTHRMTALLLLAANFGRQIPRADLLTALYGSDDRANIGALGMCLEGARKSIKKLGLPYVIVKENATVGIHPVLKPFAFN
jgi:hypothetical protein